MNKDNVVITIIVNDVKSDYTLECRGATQSQIACALMQLELVKCKLVASIGKG